MAPAIPSNLTVRHILLVSLALMLAAGCGPPASGPVGQPPARSPAADIAAMDAAIAALVARPEQEVAAIKLQHVLISFQGTPWVTDVTRTMDQARALAADVFARAARGGSLSVLVAQHSDDHGSGIYDMTRTARAAMVPGVGEVGFRLKVGEIGVAPHRIKRLE